MRVGTPEVKPGGQENRNSFCVLPIKVQRGVLDGSLSQGKHANVTYSVSKPTKHFAAPNSNEWSFNNQKPAGSRF